MRKLLSISLRNSLLAGLGLALIARGAPLSVDFDVQPRVLRLGEAAQMTIVVHGDRNAPAPAVQSTNCDLAGPNVSSQFSFNNGSLDQSVSFVYQVVPRQTGQIKLGPFNYKVGDRMFQLKEIELNIAAPTAPVVPAAAGGAQPNVALSDLVFARLEVAPTNLYVNQTFDLYLSILHREVQLDSGFSLNNWHPTGLQLGQFNQLPAQRVMIKGVVFDVSQFRCQGRALVAGHQRLAPTVRGALVVPGSRRRRSGPFDDPFFDSILGNRAETRPIDITTQPLEFDVRDVPTANRPADFNGAVGHFTLEAQVKPNDCAVGDPVTLTARISGSGNFEAIAFPMLANSAQFKTYETKMTAKELDGSQLSGSKTFEQVIIPKSLEANRIPAIGFSFFDVAKGEYVRLSAGPFDLKLQPSAASNAIIAGTGAPLAPNAPTGRDIAYLKSAPAWGESGVPELGSGPLFWPLQAVPPLAVLAAFIFARRRDARAGDVRLVRREQAPRSARRALRAAEQALAQGQRTAFFEALADALRSYFGNRLNLPPGDVTAENLLPQLSASQVDAGLSEQVRALFELCDRERFGTSGSAFDTAASQRAVEDTARLLRQFERVRL